MSMTETDGETPASTAPLAPPPPLPTGWIIRAARSHPPRGYYYHVDTGFASWEMPDEVRRAIEELSAEESGDESMTTSAEGQNTSALPSADEIAAAVAAAEGAAATVDGFNDPPSGESVPSSSKDQKTSGGSLSAPSSSGAGRNQNHRKRPHSGRDGADGGERHERNRNEPRSVDNGHGGSGPREIRCLHILRKHAGSRRPNSWRHDNGKTPITTPLEVATSEVQDLRDMLTGIADDPKELRKMFSELARTESDCSSAKRGGDLGFFGRKKMQVAFENAAFGLNVGDLSDIVKTSSGVHLIMRLA